MGLWGQFGATVNSSFKNVAVFAKPRQSLRLGDHNRMFGLFIPRIAFCRIGFRLDRTFQITVRSIRQTAMIAFLHLRQAIRFYDIQPCPSPLRPALFTECSRGRYGKTPTIHRTSRMVEWGCISGRSKLGRSKLGRNGDRKGVSAPSAKLKRTGIK